MMDTADDPAAKGWALETRLEEPILPFCEMSKTKRRRRGERKGSKRSRSPTPRFLQLADIGAVGTSYPQELWFLLNLEAARALKSFLALAVAVGWRC
jgi:hypothetical protein